MLPSLLPSNFSNEPQYLKLEKRKVIIDTARLTSSHSSVDQSSHRPQVAFAQGQKSSQNTPLQAVVSGGWKEFCVLTAPQHEGVRARGW